MRDVEQVIGGLEKMEHWKPGKLPGKNVLTSALQNGQPLSLVAVNCIDFKFEENWTYEDGFTYPLATPVAEAPSIAGYYEQDIRKVWEMLRSVTDTSLSIIIPDSELTERRAFNYSHLGTDALLTIGTQIKTDIERKLDSLVQEGAEVVFWSDYCRRNSLPIPTCMTSFMIQQIQAESIAAKNSPDLSKNAKEKRYPLAAAVGRQLESTRRYLLGNGLEEGYVEVLSDDRIRDQITAYCAMYAGEGATLARDTQRTSILLNFEDGRVPAWYQRGAQIEGRELVITTPTNPNRFYEARHNFYQTAKS